MEGFWADEAMVGSGLRIDGDERDSSTGRVRLFPEDDNKQLLSLNQCSVSIGGKKVECVKIRSLL